MSKSNLSSFHIILMGELMVNIPTLLVMALTAYLLIQVTQSFPLSLLLASIVGWMVWGMMLKVWKRWALTHNVDRERLFRLGKRGLINFYRHRIFDDQNKEKE